MSTISHRLSLSLKDETLVLVVTDAARDTTEKAEEEDTDARAIKLMRFIVGNEYGVVSCCLLSCLHRIVLLWLSVLMMMIMIIIISDIF